MLWVLAEISASDPTTILGAMVAAISAMAVYIQRISTDRVAREREITADYKIARDTAIAALDKYRQQRDDLVIETMNEIVKATGEVQANISLIAREVIAPRRRVEMIAEEDGGKKQ